MPRLITAVLLALALVLGGVLAVRAFARPALAGTEVEHMPVVPDEALVAEDGHPRRLSDWSGRTRLVFFGFTRCPDVCPATMGLLARAYEQLPREQQQQLQVVLVTVDPENDTPQVMREYLNHFHQDFAGLTGDAAALEATRKGFYVHAMKMPREQIAHGDSVAVVDGEGRYRRVYMHQDVVSGALGRDLPQLASGRY